MYSAGPSDPHASGFKLNKHDISDQSLGEDNCHAIVTKTMDYLTKNSRAVSPCSASLAEQQSVYIV